MIKIYIKKKGRKLKRPNKKEFEKYYYGLELTAEEMAEKYGVAKDTIYNWATLYRKEEANA